MFLRHIQLVDWKAHVDTTIELPRPTPGKNVILIGAKNGFGKTSLFEAVVMGLFGRDGLPLIARAPYSSGEDRLQTSYNSFLEGTLHRAALAQGRSSCSVMLRFEDEDGEPIELRRIWHFTSEGRHRAGDEELRVYEGRHGRPIGPGRGEDESEWRRAYVARRFLPHTLAGFFLFDGEHVQRLAERDMSMQVRTGIEGLLGIQVLKELVFDLEKYANNRRYSAGGSVAPKQIEKLRIDLTMLEDDLTQKRAELEKVAAEYDMVKSRRDALTREIGGLGAGAGNSTLKERHDELGRVRRAIEQNEERLQTIVMGSLSIALSGHDLRSVTLKRLQAETLLEEWQAGRKQGDKGKQRFLSVVESALPSVRPTLTKGQTASITALVAEAFETIWHPAPAGCADAYLHPFLMGGDRAAVEQRLKEIERLSMDEMARILDELDDGDRQRRRLETEIASIEGIGPQIEARVKELHELNEAADQLNAAQAALKREVSSLEAQFGQKKQDLARLVQTMHRAGPNLKRAELADAFTRALGEIIRKAVPHQTGEVAEAMTRSFRAMSHKGIVARVEIDADCHVRLLTKTGRDARDMAFSAGEQQIFAQSLISAIAVVSKRDFPIIVDTPLGRLDDAHRDGVLRHFTAREGQVILLSTDTEVVGRYLEIIKPRLASAWHLVHEHDGDIGRTHAKPGYFPGTEI